mmetsp:Transcript_87118/g.186810  ORF Transcript_87118/g.186810 Transcript_87118/m.186810 type:complete len:184 (-) Transcript_87118:23-574(-)
MVLPSPESVTTLPPLHEATQRRDIAEVRRLLAEGANVNKPDVDLYTPLHRACDLQDAGLVGLLLEAGADPDVSHPGLDGWTPLHLAAWRDAADCVALLIANGADVRALDWYGRMPVDWAGSKTLGQLAALSSALPASGSSTAKDRYVGLRAKSEPKSNSVHLEIIERSMRAAEAFDRERKSKL